MPADAWLNRIWYGRQPPPAWLKALVPLYGSLAGARRALYRRGWLRAVRLARPVVVVGNLSVGGTGKTPLVLWLVTQLRARGRRPGIVTRGFGGSQRGVRLIDGTADPQLVGDEPVLLARRSGVAVAVGRDRPAAAQLLIDSGCDVIVSDDGLQHYALARDCEIVVIDGARGLGNGRLLPAGPLRETIARLEAVDAIVVNAAGGAGGATTAGAAEVAAGVAAAAGLRAPLAGMRLEAREAVALRDGRRQPLAAFSGASVHAVAGIGNPPRFFALLRAAGIGIEEHALPDHARLSAADICFADRKPVLMTEKDAVKCRDMADERHWFVPVDAGFEASAGEVLLAVVLRRIDSRSGDDEVQRG
jgi:tetraacyldisaccharide 4'-kinase